MGRHLTILLSGLISLGFLLTTSAHAVVKITGVAGASNSSLVTGITPIIYGGISGSCASVDNVNTCDSCANATGLTTCNRKMIYPSLALKIYFTSDAAAGTPLLVKDTSKINSDTGTVSKGSTATATVTWSDVCNYLGTAGTGCGDGLTSSFTADFKVGIDVNANGSFDSGDDYSQVRIQLLIPDPAATTDLDTIDNCGANRTLPSPKPGLCDFMAYPGDSKIFLEDAEGGGSFPTVPSGTIDKIRVYPDTTGFITKPSDVDPVDLTVADAVITDKTVNGLNNGDPYYFRVSSVDKANNEMFFTSDAAIIAQCGSLTPPSPFAGSCPYAAIPDQVLGLLSKDVNCFISTAAFGSALHPHVETFRQFRNLILLPRQWGRSFVRGYYKWGPYGARWLANHSEWRPVARTLLWPLWLMSYVWVNYGLTLLLLSLFGIAGVAAAVAAALKRTRGV